MSRPTNRIPLAARLLVLAGAAAIFAQNFIHGDPTLKAGLQMGGGALALVGAAWVLFSLRRGRT